MDHVKWMNKSQKKVFVTHVSQIQKINLRLWIDHPCPTRHVGLKTPVSQKARNGEYAPLPIQRSFGLATAMWFSSEIGVRCWQLPQAQQQGHECGNGWPGLWGLTMPDHMVQAGNFLTLGQHGTTRQHAKTNNPAI